MTLPKKILSCFGWRLLTWTFLFVWLVRAIDLAVTFPAVWYTLIRRLAGKPGFLASDRSWWRENKENELRGSPAFWQRALSQVPICIICSLFARDLWTAVLTSRWVWWSFADWHPQVIDWLMVPPVQLSERMTCLRRRFTFFEHVNALDSKFWGQNMFQRDLFFDAY